MSETAEFAKVLIHVLELRNEVARELVGTDFGDVAKDHSNLFDNEATRAIVDAHVTAEVQRRLEEEERDARLARYGR